MEDIRQAYLSRTKILHPDKNPNYTKKATLLFSQLQVAYENLTKKTQPSAPSKSKLPNPQHKDVKGKISNAK